MHNIAKFQSNVLHLKGELMRRFLFVLLPALIVITAGCVDSSYPFDQVTDEFDFTYELPDDGIVDIFVLNCYMSNVRTLLSDTAQTSGSHSSMWNLLDEHGTRVPDGLYYVRIILDDHVIETKMIEVYR